MSVMQAFNPSYGGGVLAVTGAVSATSTIALQAKSVCLSNPGTVPVYVRIGTAGAVATTADMVVLAGQQKVVTRNPDADTVAYISPGGAGSLHIIPGEGW